MQDNPVVIRNCRKRFFVGIHAPMCYQNHNPSTLWATFIPRVKEIKHRIGKDFFNLQECGGKLLNQLSPNDFFERWVLVEVEKIEFVPSGMEKFELNAGKFAVMNHPGGNQEDFLKTFFYLLNTWISKSSYTLDHRPNFERLPPAYRQTGEEEIWIPVKSK